MITQQDAPSAAQASPHAALHAIALKATPQHVQRLSSAARQKRRALALAGWPQIRARSCESVKELNRFFVAYPIGQRLDGGVAALIKGDINDLNEPGLHLRADAVVSGARACCQRLGLNFPNHLHDVHKRHFVLPTGPAKCSAHVSNVVHVAGLMQVQTLVIEQEQAA